MGLRNIGFLGIVLLFSDVFVVDVLAGRLGIEGLKNSRHLDDDKVEEMWLNCGLDFSVIKEHEKSSSYSFPKDIYHNSNEISSGTSLHSSFEIREGIKRLHPEVNRIFLDCLRKQNFPLHLYSENTLRSRFVDYLESLHSKHPSSRRSLTDEPKKNDSSNVVIIVAVVLTVAGLVVVYLFFFKSESPDKDNLTAHSRKDDLPLLTPSKKSVFSKNSFASSKVMPLTIETELSEKTCDVVVDTSIDVETKSEVLLEKSDSLVKPSESPANANIPTPPPPPPKMQVLPLPPGRKPVTPLLQKPDPPPCPQPSPNAPPPPPPPPKAHQPASMGPPPPPPPGPPPPRGGPPPPPGPPPPRTPGAPNPPKTPPPCKGNLIGKQPSRRSMGLTASQELREAKKKLKPFFWDKVAAKQDQPMVWDHIKAGSFQFNEEMIETLFSYTPPDSKLGNIKEAFKDPPAQFVRIIDPKKAQNLAITLKAMNVKTKYVCEALIQGNELPSELLQPLLRMAPTSEEELKLRVFNEPNRLGPADKFLKSVLEIPFAFQRFEALLFMSSLPEDVSSTSESFSTIEVACEELRHSRLFLKLLEAVLKTGNRMNDGTFRGSAQAFKLDTLLKLADVKGTDGKTTLLHFVVQEIIRYEGIRAARIARESKSSISSINSDDLDDDVAPDSSSDYFRTLGLQAVSGLTNELENVKKAAYLDIDSLISISMSLNDKLTKTKEFLKTKLEGSEESQFLNSLRGFLEHAEIVIGNLMEKQKKIRMLVKSTTDYFHGNSGKDEGLRLFVIVRDFLGMVDKACKEVKDLPKPAPKASKPIVNKVTSPSKVEEKMSPLKKRRQVLFPAIKDRRMNSPSSNDSSSSSDDDDDDDT